MDKSCLKVNFNLAVSSVNINTILIRTITNADKEVIIRLYCIHVPENASNHL
ncbi:hypothetical protein HanIR_Chr15g0753841 [Helianthus annuus]|nr:hypothetical protein HanIR_Chr15g0753841 [Helianthus annuus]